MTKGRRTKAETKENYWRSPAGIILIQGWAKDGLSMGEIAKQMGIARSTLFRWCDRDEILKDALLVSRDIADRQVENALYKMAKGFHYKEDKVSASGKLLHGVDQYHEPNVSAAKFWLMNRKGHTWRDKQNIELQGRLDIQNDLPKLSSEELRKIAEEDDHHAMGD